jgi:hypothetical protein
MRLVPFTLQLWAPLAPLDNACNAQAGPRRHQSPIASALGQRHRRGTSWGAPSITCCRLREGKQLKVLFRFQ